MKRPLFWIGAVFLSSTASFLCLSFPLAVFCCLAIAFFAVFLSQIKLRQGVLIFISCSIFAACWVSAYNLILESRALPLLSKNTTVHMTVLSTYQNGSYHSYTGRATLELDGKSYTADNLTIHAFKDCGVFPGEVLSCISEVAFENNGSILSARSLQIAHKYDIPPPEMGRDFNPHPATKAIADLRETVSSAAADLSSNSDISGLLSALIVGDRSGISPKVAADFQKSGMSHLVVVSGLHLTMVYSIFLYLMSPLKHDRLKSLLAIAFCWFFAILTGFGSSVVRAAVMLTVAEAGRLFKLRGDSLTSLAFCCIAMTLINPYVVLSVGFLLSVGSVAGLAVFARPIENKLIRFGQNSLTKLLVKSVSVSVSAQLGAVLPLLFAFGSLPLLGVAANIPAVPVSNLVIIAAISGIAANLIFPPLGSVFGIIASVFSNIMIVISQITANIPFSQFNLTERYQIVWFIGFYLLIAVIATRRFSRRFNSRCLLGVCVSGLFCAIISLSLNLGQVDVLITEQNQCVAVVKSNHALVIGSPKTAAEARRLAESMTRLGATKLDAVILPDFNNTGTGLSSLMKAFDCDLLISRTAPSTLAFCLTNNLSLSPLEDEMLLFGGIKSEFNQDLVTLTFKEDGKITKTANACDIITASGYYNTISPLQLEEKIMRVRYRLEGTK